METCPRYPNDNHYPDLPSSASASWEDESRLFASERDVLPIMPGGYNQIPASLLTTVRLTAIHFLFTLILLFFRFAI